MRAIHSKRHTTKGGLLRGQLVLRPLLTNHKTTKKMKTSVFDYIGLTFIASL